MVDANAFIMSMKLKWIQRILNNDILQGLYNLYIDKCKLINCGTDYVLKSMHETSNIFWRDTLNAYIELCKNINSTALTFYITHYFIILL